MAKRDGATRFSEAAQALGIVVEPVTYPDGTRTAVDAAAAIGCELSQIVKSLLLMGPEGPVLALTAGHNRIDLARLALVVGGEVRMANAEQARDASGYAIGGTPPFGHPAPILTFVDPAILAHKIVYGAAGTPDRCFPIPAAELLRVTRATPANFVKV